nr:hypothetical protein CFP56_09644 [Quercus suber]
MCRRACNNLKIQFFLPACFSRSPRIWFTSSSKRAATSWAYVSPPAALISSIATRRTSYGTPSPVLRCCKMLSRRLRCTFDSRAWIKGNDNFPSLISSANPFCSVYCHSRLACLVSVMIVRMTYFCVLEVLVVVSRLKEAADHHHQTPAVQVLVSRRFGLHQVCKESEESTRLYCNVRKAMRVIIYRTYCRLPLRSTLPPSVSRSDVSSTDPILGQCVHPEGDLASSARFSKIQLITTLPVRMARAAGESFSAALIAFIMRKLAELIVCAVP